MQGPRPLGSVRCVVEGMAAWRLMVREAHPRGAPRPRLLDRVREHIRVRHFSPRTEHTYVAGVRRFILYHEKRHPSEMGDPEVTTFLTALAVDGRVTASTQNQALSALLFLYEDVLATDLPWVDGIVRARRPHRLPVVLTRRGRAMLAGSTARLASWPPSLRRRPAPAGVLPPARPGLDFATTRSSFAGPRATRIASPCCRHRQGADSRPPRRASGPSTSGPRPRRGVGELPDALARKYPNAGREWPWQWVFPATRIYRDRATGERRRHHLHETVCSARSGPRYARPASPSGRAATPSGTRSRRISWRTATTFGPCRSSWATATSARR